MLTLTEQMRQRTDFAFQNLLREARQEKLDISDIIIFNQKVATNLPDSGDLDTIVIIQKNKYWYLINYI